MDLWIMSSSAFNEVIRPGDACQRIAGDHGMKGGLRHRLYPLHPVYRAHGAKVASIVAAFPASLGHAKAIKLRVSGKEQEIPPDGGHGSRISISIDVSTQVTGVDTPSFIQAIPMPTAGSEIHDVVGDGVAAVCPVATVEVEQVFVFVEYVQMPSGGEQLGGHRGSSQATPLALAVNLDAAIRAHGIQLPFTGLHRETPPSPIAWVMAPLGRSW